MRLLMVTTALAVLVGFAGSSGESPRVWNVAPTGSDSNPGTEAAPFLTIQKAADVVNPGDTVMVEDGVYTGAGTSCGTGVLPVVCLRRGGTAAAWVTFQARHAGRAKIDGRSNTSTHGFLFKGPSYVTISGFEIVGMGSASGAAHGVMIDLGHHIVLSQLHIHDIGRVCTSTSQGLTGVFVRVPHVTITRSVFHDIGRFLPGENGCTATTTAHFDHGIYVSGEYHSSTTPGASDTLITNNIFYRLERGWAIHMYPGAVTRTWILNNTFALPNAREPGHILLAANTSELEIADNIFYKPRDNAIQHHSGFHAGLRVTNNLVFGAALMTTIPPGSVITTTRVADPLFVNAAVAPYDFHLRRESPAVGAGRPHANVAVDFDGVARADSPDVGALGYSAVSRPATSDLPAEGCD